MSRTQLIHYDMQLLGGDHQDAVGEYDYALVACGSDYRAYQTLRISKDFGLSFRRVLAFDFKERHDYLESELLESYECYNRLDLNITLIGCSIKDPSACVKALNDVDPDLRLATRIAVDISCFTKPYFFCLLKYLKEENAITQVTVLYTEPMSYVFSQDQYLSYHSTYGSLRVMEIPGFPGNDTRTTKKILVVLLGFDGELSFSIAEEVAPEETLIVNGFPAYSPKFKDISLISNEKLLSSSRAPRSMLYATASDPFETFNLLESLHKKEPSAFFNIAPLGTKPMALGACMFALCNPGVRIVYPFPDEYAQVTTQECWSSWSYQIPLGSNRDAAQKTEVV